MRGPHSSRSIRCQRLKNLAAMCDPTAPVKINIAKMSNNTNLLVLDVATNNKDIMVFHHFVELGDSRLVPYLCVIMMFGNGNIATPLTIECDELFKPFSLDPPPWEDIYKSSDTTVYLKAAPAQSGNSFTSSSIIMTPKALAVPIMTSASKDAADIGVKSSRSPIQLLTPSWFIIGLDCPSAMQYHQTIPHPLSALHLLPVMLPSGPTPCTAS
jgi:hypothetical protein